MIGNEMKFLIKFVLNLQTTTFMSDVKVSDVIGGLYAWSMHVDNEFPVY